jgi:pimeloyl-ACP methyl ester carboxylesterase
MKIQPFQINISQTVLDDLQERLTRTRWPDELEGANWDYGTNLSNLKELTSYWQNNFDWRKQEAMLNTFPQFTAEIDGMKIHFIHIKGKGKNPTPLLLLHGWPDSFHRFYKIIPMLTDPEKYGGKAENSFDVIIPSLPGYGFSDRPAKRGFTAERMAGLFAQLMSGLGYKKYAAHGGDWGSIVTEQLALHHAESLLGIHLTEVPFQHMFALYGVELSEVEQKFLEAANGWSMKEGAYAMLQSTKPQTPAYALNDSPVGLAAWMVEKFYTWSDCDGEVERCYSKDELLTNIMIYWTTQTIGSSFRLYFEGATKNWGASEKVQVPTAFAIFPKDVAPAPRAYAERFFNVRRFSEMQTGGHFAALAEPELLVQDLREFFGQLRK